MAKSYSESDMGSMKSYGKSIGVHPTKPVKPNKVKSVPKRNVSKFNRNKLKGAANKIYK